MGAASLGCGVANEHSGAENPSKNQFVAHSKNRDSVKVKASARLDELSAGAAREGTDYMRAIVRAAVALSALALSFTAVQAQRYDGSAIIKFGVFGQGTRLDTRETQPVVASGSQDGFTGGFSGGIDFHLPHHLLLGVELDGSFGDARGFVNGTDYGFDYMLNMRGRLGVYVRPDLMIYATSGVSWLGFEAQQQGVGALKAVETVTGWTVGAGVEYEWHHVIVFGEYFHGWYGSREFNLANVRHEAEIDADVFRVGLKFKVGHDHHHDIGRVYDPKPLK